MEYNENQNIEINDSLEQEPIILKEKNNGNKSIWYWIIAILLLGLLGWYGYTAGWFGSKTTTDIDNVTPGIHQQDDSDMIDEFSNDVKAPIDNITIVKGESFPVEETLSIKGTLPNGCTYLDEPQVIRKGSVFYVNLTTHTEGDVCTEALVPYERNIGLDVLGLPAGTYTVVINGKQTTFELEQDNVLDFEAGLEK